MSEVLVLDRVDRTAACLAIAVAIGAWTAVWVPLPLVVVAVVSAMVIRRPWVWLLAAALAASFLGARAQAGLVPAQPGSVEGEVMLVTDPSSAFGAVVVEVKEASGRRCQAVARGGPAGVLRTMLAGETAEVSGRVEPLELPHLAVRHVACRMEIQELGSTTPGSLPHRAANLLRRTLVQGAEGMPDGLRSLYTGFVLGDSRGQPPEVVDDFRASGLTHLLVVSGQNVTFVLLCAAPMLVRLGPWPRVAAIGGLLCFFALLTRFEPSVLRATTMAALAALAFAGARPTSGIRLLAGAVTVLLLVDPFLVRSVGFGLSVAASAGILLLARPLESVIPGPAPLARALGVVVAAQLGVTPIMVPIFGSVPVASLPANLLAGPVSGFVMVWGLTGGLLAGVLAGFGSVGEVGASIVMLPVRLALSWVAGVAERTAGLSMGELGAGSVVAVAAAGSMAAIAKKRGKKALATACMVSAIVLLLLPGITASPPGPGQHLVPSLGEMWVVATPGQEQVSVLVLDGRATPTKLLETAREAAIEKIDLVITTSGGSAAAARVRALRHRVAVGEVWGPEGNVVAGAVVPHRGEVVVGGITVDVLDVDERLEVRVGAEVPGLAV